MIKTIFGISTILIFLYGCGFKTDPVYVDSKKEQTK